jgi:hypothetical protein
LVLYQVLNTQYKKQIQSLCNSRGDHTGCRGFFVSPEFIPVDNNQEVLIIYRYYSRASCDNFVGLECNEMPKNVPLVNVWEILSWNRFGGFAIFELFENNVPYSAAEEKTYYLINFAFNVLQDVHSTTGTGVFSLSSVPPGEYYIFTDLEGDRVISTKIIRP